MQIQLFENSRKYTNKIYGTNLAVFNKIENACVTTNIENSKTKKLVTFEFKNLFFITKIVTFCVSNEVKSRQFNSFQRDNSINYQLVNYLFHNETNFLKNIRSNSFDKKVFFKTIKKRMSGHSITFFNKDLILKNNFPYEKIPSSWYSNIQNKNYSYIFGKNVTNLIKAFPELVAYSYLNKSTKSFYANKYIGIQARESAYFFREIKKEFKSKSEFFYVDNNVKKAFTFSRKAFFLLSFKKPKKVYSSKRKFKTKLNLLWTKNKIIGSKYKKIYRKINQANRNEFIFKAKAKKKSIFFKASKSLYDISDNSAVVVTNHFKIKRISQIISFLTGFSISFFRMNSLAHTRFAFDSNLIKKVSSEKIYKLSKAALTNALLKKVKKTRKKKKSSGHFLNKIQKERQSRYKYIGIYIKDLVRISFRALYSKYAQLLINFFAFSLSKLPRNRKETKFIRFLVKLVKVFSTQRKEMIGIRLRFQGRMNRWRRTKHIVGQKGTLPLHSYSTHLSYGIAQAITRKGAFGRRLWIAYDATFFNSYKKTLFNFFQVFKKN